MRQIHYALSVSPCFAIFLCENIFNEDVDMMGKGTELNTKSKKKKKKCPRLSYHQL